MYTIDGFSYTYNGIGEYTMLEMRSLPSGLTVFELQSRTTLATNISGGRVPATVFSAFVAREGNVTAQVEVNLQKNGEIRRYCHKNTHEKIRHIDIQVI